MINAKSLPKFNQNGRFPASGRGFNLSGQYGNEKRGCVLIATPLK
jgi:hypothetical protein